MDYLLYRISALPATDDVLQLLPAEEQAEAARRGGNYASIRAVLRQELSRRTHIPPREIKLTYGAHGKPECAEQPFNLSHSADYLCLAFHHKSIGVDIELIRPRKAYSVATRIMSPEQLAAFQERGCRPDDFFACWCAAEALVKHAGDTMWHARQYPFLLRHGKIICTFDNPPVVHLFTPQPGYCGAIAYSI